MGETAPECKMTDWKVETFLSLGQEPFRLQLFLSQDFPALPDKLRESLGTIICFHRTRSWMELKVFFLVLFPGAKLGIFLQS